MSAGKMLRQQVADIQKELDANTPESVLKAKANVEKLRSQLERKRHDWLYDALEPIARILKILLQMAIGVVAVILIWRLVWETRHDKWPNNLPVTGETLKIIGAGLAVAAAVELAYTLFTDGPDEAIDPLLLGLAATLMLQLGKADNLEAGQGWATVAFVIGLGLLFTIRELFVRDEPDSGRLQRFKNAWSSARRFLHFPGP